jgi:hypothetical protein
MFFMAKANDLINAKLFFLLYKKNIQIIIFTVVIKLMQFRL